MTSGENKALAPAAGKTAKSTSTVATKGTAISLGIGVAGVLLTAAVVGTLFTSPSSKPAAPIAGASRISSVPPEELAAAVKTMSPTDSVQENWLATAKSCQTPLAVLTLSRKNGAEDGFVRIHSGTFYSPWFKITEAKQQVAFPFPTPYKTGAGQVTLEGDVEGGLVVTLYPTWSSERFRGKLNIALTWDIDNPCGK